LIKIWLDDARGAPEGWVRTRTPAETIELLKSGQVEVLSLDHDLGVDDTVGTGYDVLLWLEEEVALERFLSPLPVMMAHTSNSAARPRMEMAIEQIKRLAERNQHLED